MGLINKLFGRDKGGRNSAPASEFDDSEDNTEGSNSRANTRRELIQVVFRDTLRRHGIPSDWVECKILAVVSKKASTGMHVQLIVHKGDDRLLTYVHAFQNSFITEIARFDPNASDWMLSLAWQFEGNDMPQKDMPNPGAWTSPGALAAAAAVPMVQMIDTGDSGVDDEDDLSEDLKALFAIRDAAITGMAGLDDGQGDSVGDFQPTQPGMGDDDPPPSALRKKR